MSSLMAQENIALAAASVWLATLADFMQENAAFTSERVIALAFIFPHFGTRSL
jgi:hypothetical protein